MARSASIWILCFGAWTKSGPNTTLIGILRRIDRGTFLLKSEKKCSKRGPKTGSDLEQLSFANRNLWGLLFRTVDKFREFYRGVHGPVRSACTPRWNSLKVRNDGTTERRTNISIWSSRKGNKRFAQKSEGDSSNDLKSVSRTIFNIMKWFESV